MGISTLVDLVKVVITSTGTGPFILGAAVAGFDGIDALTNGATYSYSVQQDGAYEVGTGVYVSTSHLLTRTVKKSSDGGVAINVTPGMTVSFVALAQDLQTGGAPDTSAIQAALVGLLQSLTDIGENDPPAAPAVYLSGGVVKFAKA